MDSCPFWSLIFVVPFSLLIWALQHVGKPGGIAAYLPSLLRPPKPVPPYENESVPGIPAPFQIPPAALERTELEQYIDRRVEELLEPTYWSRVVSGEIRHTVSRAPISRDVATLEVEGLWILWHAPGAPNRSVWLALVGSDWRDPGIIYLRDPLALRYADAFRAAWPDQVPEVPKPAPPPSPAEMIARLEARRRPHEAVS